MTSSASAASLGFIGLGIMGAPMAGHLLAAGHRLAVNTRSAVPQALLDAGALSCQDAKSVAERADIVFLMLPDTPDVEGVLFGESGVAQGIKPGSVVVDMSSISPIATREFANRIASLGAHYVDAPVSGGEVGARNAALSIMVGADKSVFDRVLPFFLRMGKNITHVGAVSAGQTAKVANQIIVALTIEAVSEALVFAKKAGADPARVREALMGGFASSRILEVHGQRMIDRTFNPGFRIGLHQKDLNLALSSAQALGVSLPSTAVAQQLFNSCVAQGKRDADHSAMVTALESLAGCALDGQNPQARA
jgi:2-hydroxy-3-oxopropionate reductase